MSRPIAFLVGVQRSGTTALATSLSRHPELALLVNGKIAYLLIVWLWRQRSHIEALHPRLDEVAHAFLRRRPRNLDQATCERIASYLVNGASHHFLKSSDLDQTRQALRAVCEDVASFVNPSWQCNLDKYNEYLLQIPDLEAVFPDARYIFIHRNAYDVAESMVRHFSDRCWAPNNHLVALNKWMYWNGLWVKCRLGIAPLRRHEVCYEQLVREPYRTFKKIFEFLDVDADDKLVRDACVGVHSDAVGQGATVARELRNAGRWPCSERERMVEWIHAMSEELSSCITDV